MNISRPSSPSTSTSASSSRSSSPSPSPRSEDPLLWDLSPPGSPRQDEPPGLASSPRSESPARDRSVQRPVPQNFTLPPAADLPGLHVLPGLQRGQRHPASFQGAFDTYANTFSNFNLHNPFLSMSPLDAAHMFRNPPPTNQPGADAHLSGLPPPGMTGQDHDAYRPNPLATQGSDPLSFDDSSANILAANNETLFEEMLRQFEETNPHCVGSTHSPGVPDFATPQSNHTPMSDASPGLHALKAMTSISGEQPERTEKDEKSASGVKRKSSDAIQSPPSKQQKVSGSDPTIPPESK